MQIFFAVIFIPILLLLTLLVFNHIYKSTRRSTWLFTEGMIEDSSIQHDHDGDPYITLRYKFFIDDQPYWGDQNIVIINRNKAEELLLKIPVSQQIKIQYSPDDPETQPQLVN